MFDALTEEKDKNVLYSKNKQKKMLKQYVFLLSQPLV